jgi:uncharacterized membrane protein YhaH (DUF805 family)
MTVNDSAVNSVTISISKDTLIIILFIVFIVIVTQLTIECRRLNDRLNTLTSNLTTAQKA